MAGIRNVAGSGARVRIARGRAGSLVVPGVVLALALCYFLDPNGRLDFSAFDTRDAESYLALSRALASGVGYTRNLDPHYYIPHTTWPPGLPVMLLPAVALAGMPINLTIVKLGMIAYGALGIVLAYSWARRTSATAAAQLGTPLLLALDPYYWQLSRMVLSEVPTILWALVVLLLADLGWARGSIRPAPAFGFGLIAGLGMLIHGTLFGALFLPLAYLLVLRADRIDLRRVASYLAYAVGFVVPFALWKLRCSAFATEALGQDGINQLAMILRTHPVDPASPLRTLSQIAADMRATAATAIFQAPRALVPGLWSRDVWAWLGAGASPVAAALTVGAVALSCAARRNLPIILLYGSMAALNLFYAAGQMTRLWVPVTALLAISLPQGCESLSLFRRRGAAWAAMAFGGALAASLALFIVRHDAHPYRDRSYAALAALFETIRDAPPLDGNVLTPDPQAFALVTGLHAPMPKVAIGVDPSFSYVVLPNDELSSRIGGTVIMKNAVWSLVKLDAPLDIAALRQRIDCKSAPIAAFAVVANCPMW